MMFPDCRNDDAYNQDFVIEKDHQFLRGYDWCAEEVVDNFFNNLDVYFDDDSHLMHTLNEELPKDMQFEEEIERTFAHPDDKKEIRQIKTYADLLRSKLQEWIENERDVLITSMIDDMDEEVYNAIRNKILLENKALPAEEQKEYYDTRKFQVTGKKEFNQ